MKKLKTLKDIEMESTNPHAIEMVLKFENKLKEEAIKWVKSMMFMEEKYMQAINKFHEFFNITEEDLK